MNDKSTGFGVFSGFYSALVAFGQSRGLSFEDMLAVAGVSPVEIVDPSKRLPDRGAQALWQYIDDTDKNGILPIELAKAAPLTVFGGLAEGLQFAPTLSSALEHLSQNRAVLADRLSLAVTKNADQVTLSLSHELDRVDKGHLSSLGIFLVKRLVEDVIGVPGAINRVRLTMPDRGSTKSYRSYFGAEVLIHQAVNEISFSREACDRPIRRANPELFSYVHHHFRNLRSTIAFNEGPPNLLRLREAILENALQSEYGPNAAAQRANLSLRTAQRIASKSGCSLKSLIDEVRFENAKVLLSDPELTTSKVAFALSFSDDRSFRRAFKRYFGVSPSQYRLSLGDK